MGKTMSKSGVIFGAQQAVKLTHVDLTAVTKAIRRYVSDDAPLNLGPARSIVEAAKREFKEKASEAYVKVGLVGNHLVLRCKLERKLLPALERDGLIVKDWPEFMAANPPAVPPEPTGETDATDTETDETETETDAAPPVQGWTDANTAQGARSARTGGVQVGTGRQTPVTQPTDPSTDSSSSPTGQGNPPPTVPPQPVQTPEEKKAAQAARLEGVMTRKDANGESLRDRLWRAVAKEKVLRTDQTFAEENKAQGLKPLEEMYHGEVIDHQKHRYGRFMGPMQKTWIEEGASQTHNFSEWLDAVEANATTVAGVKKGRVIFDLFVKSTGGKVDYLDEETRKPYLATVKNGMLKADMIGPSPDGNPTECIFVIGPDDKLYVGTKERAAAGEEGAFNHSSFFSGGAVKSAGTMHVSNEGRILGIDDTSGHYAPDEKMVALACRTFAEDITAKRRIQVRVGKNNWTPASVFLGDETAEQANAALKEEREKQNQAETERVAAVNHLAANLPRHAAYSASVDGAAAERLLAGKEGAWLLRPNTRGGVSVSVCQQGQVFHCPLGGAQFPTAASFAEFINALNPAALVKPGTPPPRAAAGPETPDVIAARLRQHPGFHASIDDAGGIQLLAGREGAWLLRPSSQGGVVVSIIKNGEAKKFLMDDKDLQKAQAFEKFVLGFDQGAVVRA